MSEPVRIEMETAADGRELIEALARRGLIGRLVSTGSRWNVEIHSPREEARRVLHDLEPALGLWLADRRRASIPLRVGARSLLVRAGRPGSGGLLDGGPNVVPLPGQEGEKGGIDGSDRQMEPVA